MGRAGALAFAKQHLGLHEISDRNKLSALFSSKGIKVDPATTAWCAAFANTSLRAAGFKGVDPAKGGNIANAFGRYGSAVKPEDVQPGDVVVEHRGKGIGGLGGHIGIATGRTSDGQIETIGGNVGNKVAKSWSNAARVWVRRPGDEDRVMANAGRLGAEGAHAGPPLSSGPVSNDNSRSVNQNINYNTNISTNDAATANSMYRRTHENLAGQQLAHAKTVVR
jgi:uncharacterized protein (TIGR02594 family)